MCQRCRKWDIQSTSPQSFAPACALSNTRRIQVLRHHSQMSIKRQECHSNVQARQQGYRRGLARTRPPLASTVAYNLTSRHTRHGADNRVLGHMTLATAWQKWTHFNGTRADFSRAECTLPSRGSTSARPITSSIENCTRIHAREKRGRYACRRLAYAPTLMRVSSHTHSPTHSLTLSLHQSHTHTHLGKFTKRQLPLSDCFLPATQIREAQATN